MKFKTKEEMKDTIESLGHAAVSKFSAINYLAKSNIPLDPLISIDVIIREIECGLWSLIPLGLGDDAELFNGQVESLKGSFDSIIKASKAMKSLMEGMK